MQALICSTNSGVTTKQLKQADPELHKGSRAVVASFIVAFPSSVGTISLNKRHLEQTIQHAAVSVKLSQQLLVGNATDSDGNRYWILDTDTNPANNLPQLSGIDDLRLACAVFGLRPVRVRSAEQVHTVLRPMLQRAGYNLRRKSGIPLAMDYNVRNTYEALDDAAVSVMFALSELHTNYGYKGDHKADSTGGKQVRMHIYETVYA
jgi:hypothetical protein